MSIDKACEFSIRAHRLNETAIIWGVVTIKAAADRDAQQQEEHSTQLVSRHCYYQRLA
jgi:hypothetical protein